MDTPFILFFLHLFADKPDSHRSFLGAIFCFSFLHLDLQQMSTLLWSLQRQLRAQTPQVFLWPDPLEASCNISIVNADSAYCFLIILFIDSLQKKGEWGWIPKRAVPPYKYWGITLTPNNSTFEIQDHRNKAIGEQFLPRSDKQSGKKQFATFK